MRHSQHGGANTFDVAGVKETLSDPVALQTILL